MVKQGTVLINSDTKDETTFLETSESSGGKLTKIKFLFRVGSPKPQKHIHQVQDEKIEVISGYFTCEYKGEKKKLGPGESITLLKGVPHKHYNEENTDCEVLQTITPALDFEDMVVSVNQLVEQGKIVNGKPPLLEVMVWLRKYQSKIYLAGVPVGIQNGMAAVLAPIGRMLGYGG